MPRVMKTITAIRKGLFSLAQAVAAYASLCTTWRRLNDAASVIAAAWRRSIKRQRYLQLVEGALPSLASYECMCE